MLNNHKPNYHYSPLPACPINGSSMVQIPVTVADSPFPPSKKLSRFSISRSRFHSAIISMYLFLSDSFGWWCSNNLSTSPSGTSTNSTRLSPSQAEFSPTSTSSFFSLKKFVFQSTHYIFISKSRLLSFFEALALVMHQTAG